ncbi:hypothetical protein FOA52_000144 [Chlamydomonas sp. UWO 241]|nr:hypothetical protein FOA52_000144 [Chlamydomonas sp. UWO 241]
MECPRTPSTTTHHRTTRTLEVLMYMPRLCMGRSDRRRERSRSRDRSSLDDYRRDRASARRRNDTFESELAAGFDGDLSGGGALQGRGYERGYERDGRDRDGRGSRDRERRPSEWDRDRDGGDGGRGGSWRPQPSATVYIKNLPFDFTEDDIHALLAAFPNVVDVRLGRDRDTRQSRGFAFVDFASEADSARLIEHADREGLSAGGNKLSIQYSMNPETGRRSGGAAGDGEQGRGERPDARGGADQQQGGRGGERPPRGGGGATADWLCGMCASVNFARRTECYKCSAVQPENPTRVAHDGDGPGAVLKVSNLDADCAESALRALFSAAVPVIDVRLVMDKFSGMPRGFAFVEYEHSTDATRAMNMLQGVVMAGASGGLRICYARDRAAALAPATGNASAQGHDALQAAQAMAAYSSWEPKSYGGDGGGGCGPTALDVVAGGWEPKAFGDGEEEDEDKAGGTGDAAAQQPAVAQAAAPAAGGARAGMVYDASTGYWYDAASGYYYDANTGLHYHRTTNQWYSHNHATGEYSVAGGGQSTTETQQQQQQAGGSSDGGSAQAAAAGPSSAAQSAIAAAEFAMAARAEAAKSAAATAAAKQQAAKQQQQAKTKAAAGVAVAAAVAAKQRGAVIGSAPQLSSAGLMAMVQLLEEKELQDKALAAMKAADAAKQQAKAKAAAPPAAPAPIQGVVHKGKWASRNQQAK